MKPEEFYQHLKYQLDIAMNGSQALSTEAMAYIKAATHNLFNELHLVSKDEFDAQKAVIARTIEKIEKLETQIAELERKL